MVEVTRSLRKAKITYKTTPGEHVPGVTSILALRNKPALVDWAFRLGQQNPDLRSSRDYTDDLARIGQLAHYYVECRMRGEEPDTGDWTPNELKAAAPAVAKFDAWLKGRDFQIIEAEKQVVSDAYRFGGTIDLYAKLDGKFAVCDIKTSKGIYGEHLLQVAAYAELLREAGEQVDEIRILRIGRIGSEGLEERFLPEWSLYWKAFLHLRDLYETEKAIERSERANI